MDCGAPLPTACPACGYANEPSEKFCGGCGAPILRPAPEDVEPPSPGPTAVSPSGELRPVTVLFADLCEFTRLSRESDPETVHEILGRYFAAVDGMVGKYGGIIDKHIGDSVMAVFGAPVAHGNDPERAVRAAVEIQMQ
jgi:class 3 adenylate cyclase